MKRILGLILPISFLFSMNVYAMDSNAITRLLSLPATQREQLLRQLTPAEAAAMRAQAEASAAAEAARTAETIQTQQTRRATIEANARIESERYRAQIANSNANEEEARRRRVIAEREAQQEKHQQDIQREAIRAANDRQNQTEKARLERENLDRKNNQERQNFEEKSRQERENLDRKNRQDRENAESTARLNDQLTRQRDADRRAEEARAQQEAIEREQRAQQERLARENEAHAQKMKQEAEAHQVKAKADADKEKAIQDHKLEQWRQNKATVQEMNEAQAVLDQKKHIAGITAKVTEMKKAIFEFTDNKERMKSVGKFIALTTIATAGGILFVKHALPIIRQAVENRLFTPKMIQESSYSMLPDWISSWFGKKNKYESSENLYFDSNLSMLINEIKTTLTNTKKNGGFYMNYLFYGLPGTGKTATARALAYESGMDFAFMTGGDVLDLLKSGKAIQRLNEVFDWAQRSKKGLILFIDECDAFLGNPSTMSEELNAILKAFLNRTGTESKHFCLILSTNHPDQLSKAVLSRVGYRQQIRFDTPGVEARKNIIKHFMGKYLANNQLLENTSSITNDSTINSIAQQTNGFSGRDLSYLILGIEKAALASENPVVNNALINRVVSQAVAAFTEAQHHKNYA